MNQTRHPGKKPLRAQSRESLALDREIAAFRASRDHGLAALYEPFVRAGMSHAQTMNALAMLAGRPYGGPILQILAERAAARAIASQ
jgi:hypothetical protein